METAKELPWGRLPNETFKAYTAFMLYLRLHPKERTMKNAYRIEKGVPRDEDIELSRHWTDWASRFHWIARAKAYDDERAADELAKWEQRKEAARERDWRQAEALRDIVEGAIPTATQFFRRQVGQPQGGMPTIVNEAGQVIRQGTPSQVIVTVAYDIVGITRVLVDTSKMQRLIVDEPTDNINNLTGAALDAALSHAMAQWALDNVPDDSQTGDTTQAPDGGPEAEEETDEGTSE